MTSSAPGTENSHLKRPNARARGKFIRSAWVPALVICGVVVLCGLLTMRSKLSVIKAEPEKKQTSAKLVSDEQPAAKDTTFNSPDTIEPLDLIPAENLLCWKGLPFPGAERKSDEPSSLQTLLDLAGRVFGDKLEDGQKFSLRLLETLGIIGQYPFAITLIDATVKPTREDGSGAKLDELRIAAIIKTGDDAARFLRIIQKAINELTDAGAATLVTKHAYQWEYQELTDSRLPTWCAIAWGQLDRHFVLTFGQNVWPTIAAVARGEADSVNKIEWVHQVRKQRRDKPLIEVLVAAEDIRKRLDPFVDGRATAFFKAWGIEDVKRTHWALGFQGRALYCLANHRKGNVTRRRLYANPHIKDNNLLEAIPDEARYAIYNIPVKTFLPKLISSFYATRNPEDRELAAKTWAEIQANLGIDAQRDALDHLGEHIVAHNYPPHPFHLPLAFTSLIEIRDEPRMVRQTLEKLLSAWQEAIEKASDETGKPCPIEIRHDDDGVWYIEFPFFNGVAWTFTDRFIVTSWSPIALRDYLDKMGDKIGTR